MSSKLRIIVGGMVGQFPLGGPAWDYLHYMLGLHELGHDVYYHEDTWTWPLDPAKGHLTDDPAASVAIFNHFFDRYAPALRDKWHYLLLHETHFGMSKESFDEVCRTADLFINVSGACFMPEELNPRCVKIFLDTDPGYNQIVMHTRPSWSQNVDRWIAQIKSHDKHFTYAENIYGSDCKIPRCGIDWITTRCVVTLPAWQKIKNAPPPSDAPFSTIMSWGYFNGKLIHDGVEYFAKAEEYAKFHDLPRRLDVPMLLAVGGYTQDPKQIQADGWRWIDARPMSATPESYANFIRDSVAEWSIAKNVFVGTRSGWFSCRTACYLAAGRPAVVQDTGWSNYIPSGSGVIAFDTMEQAIAGVNEVAGHLAKHRTAAYEIAREYLAPDKVLTPMLESALNS